MTHKSLTNNDDTYAGSENADVINGLKGDDSIFGSGGDDVIHGNAGDDILRASSGNDHLYGDAGDDYMTVYTGHQVLNGGSGTDFIDFYYATKGVDIDLADDSTRYKIGSTNYRVDYISIEAVDGSAKNDTETGTSKQNVLRGEDGNDHLVGLGGDDFLFGGNGRDIMTGGKGSDSFMFGSYPDGKKHFDTVTDFDGTADRIGLNASTFDVDGTGKVSHILNTDYQNMDANQFQSGAGHVAATADVRVIYDTTNGILYYDSNGSAAGGLGELADLGKHQHISDDSVIIYGF